MTGTRSGRRNIAATSRAKQLDGDGAGIDAAIKLLIDRHTELTVMLATAIADKRRRHPRGATAKR